MAISSISAVAPSTTAKAAAPKGLVENRNGALNIPTIPTEVKNEAREKSSAAFKEAMEAFKAGEIGKGLVNLGKSFFYGLGTLDPAIYTVKEQTDTFVK